MPTTWTISINWDRDGGFTEPYDDVTARTLSADWFLGFQTLYMDTADNSKLRLVLDNSDKRFSPENPSSPIAGKVRPFVPVRIQSVAAWDGEELAEGQEESDPYTRTHWVGWIETIQPDVNQFGQRRVTITAAGPMLFFKAAETNIELQINQRTDAIIDKLLDEVVIPPPLTGAWYLHADGANIANPSPIGIWYKLGDNTILTDPSAERDLDAGLVTLALAADNWIARDREKDAKFNVYRAIADVVAAERGRFYFDREARAIFKNRLWLQDDIVPTVTLDNTMVDMTYSYASTDNDFKNEILVTCHPRSLSEETNALLWKVKKPITISPGKAQKVEVTYRDKDAGESRIGGIDVFFDDVTFSDGTAAITMEAKANSATLKLKNEGGGDAILSSLSVRGQKITDFGELEAEAVNTASIAMYGQRTLAMNLLSIEDLDYAQAIAEYELSRRGLPRGLVKQVTLKSHGKSGGGLHIKQLSQTIGHTVTISESQTEHEGRYVIIGEAHKLTASATLFETTWYLEPVKDSDFPWDLEMSGRSNLGTTTRLAF